MSLRRIAVLLGKEFAHGTKSYFFIFAVVAPLILTAFVQLAFGSLFSGTPKLGYYDPGASQVIRALANSTSLSVREYHSEADLKGTVERGARDVGVVLREDFDAKVLSGEATEVTSYVWGESLLKDRTIIGAAFLSEVRRLSGETAQVEIRTVPLGDEDTVPLEDRFLPVIVLMAIFISGFAVPATSLVEEKEKRTIGALLSTPVTQGDLFLAKGAMGLLVSVTMGLVVLLLNHALTAQLSSLLLILFLGAVMACCFGLVFGAFMKDIASMYTAIKGLGIVLYGPGIVSLFPAIPSWIGKIFPTYYVIYPIMKLARGGSSWADIKLDVMLLLLIIAACLIVTGFIAKATRQQEV